MDNADDMGMKKALEDIINQNIRMKKALEKIVDERIYEKLMVRRVANWVEEVTGLRLKVIGADRFLEAQHENGEWYTLHSWNRPDLEMEENDK
jgi:hypothetical protein